MKNLIYAALLLMVGQTMIWFQTNGQFFWKWAKDHPFLMALIFSTPISVIFIKATELIVLYFNGSLWPGRLIGFAMGILTFTFFTSVIMGEGINSKSAISLVLAAALVLIQILWK
tara:strand:- start:871 stop:1215 length:345 start_codon:yes stop_codon:yes gene_type:complete